MFIAVTFEFNKTINWTHNKMAGFFDRPFSITSNFYLGNFHDGNNCRIFDVPLPHLNKNIDLPSRKNQGKGPHLHIELSKFAAKFSFLN